MKALRLGAVAAAICMALAPGVAGAGGGQPGGGLVVSPPPPAFPPGRMGGFHHGFNHDFNHGFNGGFFFYERDYVPVVVQEPRDEKPADPPAAPAPPPEPRKPYVIGRSYSSLPGGCMKLIEDGISYFNCSGRWYREVTGGGDAQYRAVAHP